MVSVFSTYDWLSDTLDILLLTLCFYYVLKLIRDTRAVTFAKGLVIFVLAYLVVLLLDMKSSVFIFRQIFNNILVILVILFAPELRKLLEKIGTNRSFMRLSSFFGRGPSQKALQYNAAVSKTVNSVCKAAVDMSDKKIGALIIFERDLPLGEIIDTGTVVDAKVSSQIIGNVFYRLLFMTAPPLFEITGSTPPAVFFLSQTVTKRWQRNSALGIGLPSACQSRVMRLFLWSRKRPAPSPLHRVALFSGISPTERSEKFC